MIAPSADIEAGQLEPALGKKVRGGEIVGARLGCDGAKFSLPRLADGAKDHCRAQALPPVFEIHAKVVQAKKPRFRLEFCDEQRHIDSVVVGDQSQSVFDASCNLPKDKKRFIGWGIALHPLVPEGTLFQFPRSGKSFTGLFDVKITAGLDRSVDVDEPIEVRRPNGSHFHFSKIPRARFRVRSNLKIHGLSFGGRSGSSRPIQIVIMMSA